VRGAGYVSKKPLLVRNKNGCQIGIPCLPCRGGGGLGLWVGLGGVVWGAQDGMWVFLRVPGRCVVRSYEGDVRCPETNGQGLMSAKLRDSYKD